MSINVILNQKQYESLLKTIKKFFCGSWDTRYKEEYKTLLNITSQYEKNLKDNNLSKELKTSKKSKEPNHKRIKISDVVFCELKSADGRLKSSLTNCGINTLGSLCRETEESISSIHGVSKNSLEKIKGVLNKHGLSFKS